MNSWLSSLSSSARIGLLAGVLVIVSATIAVALSLSGQRFDVLFTDLREADAAAVRDQLEAWKVPFEIHDEGRTIAVASEEVPATRLRLVSAGVPSGGRVGFELFKDSNFGVTEFAQKINFQRALQGELERTIAAFEAVEHVRVHLNLNDSKGLLSRDQPNKASVALSLRPHAKLSAAQVSGIQNLIAASVEGLAAQSVVVLDETGASLTADSEFPASSIDARLADQQRIESMLSTRVGSILSHVFPLEQVSIAVDVQLNLDRVSLEKEQITPQGANGVGLVVRERRDGPAAAPATASGEPATRRPAVQSEVEYLHGREREQIVPAPGRIERLSVAVAVPSTANAETLQKVQAIIAAAVGLQPQRGDHLEVVALVPPAALNTELERPTISAAQPVPATRSEWLPRQPWWSIGTMLGLFGISLVMGLWIGRASSRRSLTAAERDAAMAQIRAWLGHEGARP